MITRNRDRDVLFSLYINKKAKQDFATTCIAKNTTMTAELNRFIQSYNKENKTYVEEHMDYFGNIVQPKTSSNYFEDEESENW